MGIWLRCFQHTRDFCSPGVFANNDFISGSSGVLRVSCNQSLRLTIKKTNTFKNRNVAFAPVTQKQRRSTISFRQMHIHGRRGSEPETPRQPFSMQGVNVSLHAFCFFRQSVHGVGYGHWRRICQISGAPFEKAVLICICNCFWL